MLSSREEQRFQFERALSRELESTLGALDGVFEARVHLNLPPIDPIFGQQLSPTKGTASVLLLVGADFSAHLTEISSMVAGASGIPIGGVSVLVSQSKELAALPPEQKELGLTTTTNSELDQSSGLMDRISVRGVLEITIALLILGIGIFSILHSCTKRVRGGASLEGKPFNAEGVGNAS